MTETLIPACFTIPYGIVEAHAVLFQPRADHGGPANVVSILIPEAEPSMELAALDQARHMQARVVILCDTAAQAQAARIRVKALLPDHREVAIDRAQAGAWRPM